MATSPRLRRLETLPRPMTLVDLPRVLTLPRPMMLVDLPRVLTLALVDLPRVLILLPVTPQRLVGIPQRLAVTCPRCSPRCPMRR